jgi:hypothetical protein
LNPKGLSRPVAGKLYLYLTRVVENTVSRNGTNDEAQRKHGFANTASRVKGRGASKSKVACAHLNNYEVKKKLITNTVTSACDVIGPIISVFAYSRTAAHETPLFFRYFTSYTACSE